MLWKKLVFVSGFTFLNMCCSKIYNYLNKLANVAISWIWSDWICLSPWSLRQCFKMTPENTSQTFTLLRLANKFILWKQLVLRRTEQRRWKIVVHEAKACGALAPSVQAEEGLIVLWAQGRSSVCFRAHVNSSFVFLELQMSVCGASFSLMWAGALGDSQGDLCSKYRCQLER